MSTHDVVLHCRDVRHGFGDKPVLFDVNLKIVRGEIVGLVGPSGCGKSTLLKAVIGTHLPRQGKIVVVNENGVANVVAGPGRDRGIVYQNYVLFEFLTALENVAFGLMLDKTTIPKRVLRPFAWSRLRREHVRRAEEVLVEFGLGDAMHRYPSELSGGMQQRVALAQALILEPEILLLDEPFGALDEATREDLQRMMLRLYAENIAARTRGDHGHLRTFMIVTHELTEAIFVADRIVGLSQYWDWTSEGFERCPGATIVYDRISPVFAPDAEKDWSKFTAQRDEVHAAVFNPSVTPQRNQYVRFWDELTDRKGEGVLAS